MVQAPNSYPDWVAPRAPVELDFSPRFLTNFARHFAEVGPPPARLAYRVVDPADFGLEVASTQWLERGRPRCRFSFQATVPGPTNAWSRAPRGTVLLLHGYGLAQYSMAPWALRLAEDGWRAVLVDLRGHGKSTGQRVHFGLVETNDLTQLLGVLEQRGLLTAPVAVLGESYGAALALRWQAVEPRIDRLVALAPYAQLSTAVLNIRREYAPWFPKFVIAAGIKRLPRVLGVSAADLDPLTVLDRQPGLALFVAGSDDRIAPIREVRRLSDRALPGSRLVVVDRATHEALAYFFDDLVAPVLDWLNHGSGALTQTSPGPGSGWP
jgi:pimeloyl-ACP methyl ester carboxylesterase